MSADSTSVDGRTSTATSSRVPAGLSLREPMSPFWIYTQVAIVAFVLAGIVIGAVKLF
jgi:hypothetical protein